jgi:hypothetical protein
VQRFRQPVQGALGQVDPAAVDSLILLLRQTRRRAARPSDALFRVCWVAGDGIMRFNVAGLLTLVLYLAAGCGWSTRDRDRFLYVCNQGGLLADNPPAAPGNGVFFKTPSGEIVEFKVEDAPKVAEFRGYSAATSAEVFQFKAETKRAIDYAAFSKSKCGCVLKLAERSTASFDEWIKHREDEPPSASVDRRRECGLRN